MNFVRRLFFIATKNRPPLSKAKNTLALTNSHKINYVGTPQFPLKHNSEEIKACNRSIYEQINDA